MRKFTILTILIACSLLLVACGGASVPDVRGKTLDRATEILKDAGFTVGDVKYDEGASAPPGDVTAQTPSAGGFADKGSEIDLTVAGPPPVSVPDLAGMSAEEAKMVLGAAGLRLGDPKVVADKKAEPGVITSQSPVPGQLVLAGTTIAVMVNAGSPATSATAAGGAAAAPAPNVQGLTQAAATQRLMAAGYTVTVQRRGPGNTVVSQTQSPSTGGGGGGTVVIIVGSPDAIPKKAVPNVSGLSQAEATSKLKASGFQVDVTDWWLHVNIQLAEAQTAGGEWKYDVGDVVSTAPGEGQQVIPGSTITIRVFRR